MSQSQPPEYPDFCDIIDAWDETGVAARGGLGRRGGCLSGCPDIALKLFVNGICPKTTKSAGAFCGFPETKKVGEMSTFSGSVCMRA